MGTIRRASQIVGWGPGLLLSCLFLGPALAAQAGPNGTEAPSEAADGGTKEAPEPNAPSSLLSVKPSTHLKFDPDKAVENLKKAAVEGKFQKPAGGSKATAAIAPATREADGKGNIQHDKEDVDTSSTRDVTLDFSNTQSVTQLDGGFIKRAQ